MQRYLHFDFWHFNEQQEASFKQAPPTARHEPGVAVGVGVAVRVAVGRAVGVGDGAALSPPVTVTTIALARPMFPAGSRATALNECGPLTDFDESQVIE